MVTDGASAEFSLRAAAGRIRACLSIIRSVPASPFARCVGSAWLSPQNMLEGILYGRQAALVSIVALALINPFPAAGSDLNYRNGSGDGWIVVGDLIKNISHSVGNAEVSKGLPLRVDNLRYRIGSVADRKIYSGETQGARAFDSVLSDIAYAVIKTAAIKVRLHSIYVGISKKEPDCMYRGYFGSIADNAFDFVERPCVDAVYMDRYAATFTKFVFYNLIDTLNNDTIVDVLKPTGFGHDDIAGNTYFADFSWGLVWGCFPTVCPDVDGVGTPKSNNSSRLSTCGEPEKDDNCQESAHSDHSRPFEGVANTPSKSGSGCTNVALRRAGIARR